MEKTIPPGAQLLLRFISQTETGRSAPECYGVIYGNNQGKLKKPLIQMTLDEVEADGPRRTKAYGSSAAGAYQFMRDTLDKPGTLKDLEGELGLTGKELFTGDLQDLLGFQLLKRRGYLDFAAGRINRDTFAKNLAKEWASYPVLHTTMGATRALARGQSFYAGDGMNKALITPEQVEQMLDQVWFADHQPKAATQPVAPVAAPIPHPAPAPASIPAAVATPVAQPAPQPVVKTAGIVSLILLVGAAAFSQLSDFSCNLLNLWC